MRLNTRAAVLVLVLAACDNDSPTEEPSAIDQIREATELYAQVAAATAAGYQPAGPCVASPVGGMGIHYVKQALVDGVVNPNEPEALLYVPKTGGGMELVGVEYIVASGAWDAANTVAPQVLGKSFDDHRPEAARHGMPFPHYDLHAWVWKENPAGLHAPFNSSVTCPAPAVVAHGHAH